MSAPDRDDVFKYLSWGATSFLERSSSRSLALAVTVFAGSLAVFLIFSAFFEVELRVRASGRINSLHGIKHVVSGREGLIEADATNGLVVGATVEKDQILAKIKFDSTTEGELSALREALIATHEKLREDPTASFSEAASKVPDQQVRAQLIEVAKRLEGLAFLKSEATSRLRTELAPIRQRLAVVGRQLKRIETSKNRTYLLAQKFAIEEEQGRLLAQLSAQQNAFEARLHASYLEAERSLEIAISGLELLVQSHRIRAPASGKIVKVAATAGTHVRSSEVVASLVPSDAPMIAEILVSSEDVGRVSEGAKTLLAIDAYPHYKFGYFVGQVLSLEKMTTTAPDGEAKFLAKIRIEGRHGREPAAELEKFPLIPGMKVDGQVVWKRASLARVLRDFVLGEER